MHRIKKKRHYDHSKSSSSMSEKQRSLMLDFLSGHPSMILDRSVGGSSNKSSKDELWEQLAIVLNNCGPGAQKDGCGWRRSWHDLKRYESLKAKESMAKLEERTETLKEPPVLVLSPLQEKIANLLNVSIADVTECLGLESAHEIPRKLTQLCDDGEGQPKPQTCSKDAHRETSKIITGTQDGGNSAAEVKIAQVLQDIASALTQRNAIEERKVRVFENFLTAYATKNCIANANTANIDRDLK